MDSNLTGLVAINVTQMGWLPYFSAFTGPLSALIGAISVVAAQRLTQGKEKARKQREERKQAYTSFLADTLVMGMNPKPNYAAPNFAKSFAEIEIVGSDGVVKKIHELNLNPSSLWQNSERIRNELIPLIRRELQD